MNSEYFFLERTTSNWHQCLKSSVATGSAYHEHIFIIKLVVVSGTQCNLNWEIRIHSMDDKNPAETQPITIRGNHTMWQIVYIYVFIYTLHHHPGIAPSDRHQQTSGNFTQFVTLLSNQHENILSFILPAQFNTNKCPLLPTSLHPPTYYPSLLLVIVV